MQSRLTSNREDVAKKVLRVFEEIAIALEVPHPSKVRSAKASSAASRQFFEYIASGFNASVALSLICQENHQSFGFYIFGDALTLYDRESDHLVGSSGGKRLHVVLNLPQRLALSQTGFDEDSIILLTDFRTFNFFRRSSDFSVTEPFLSCSTTEMADEIALTGSIWDTVFPRHFAVLSRTISYSISKEMSSSGPMKSSSNELEGEAFEWLLRLCACETKLVCLDDLVNEIRTIQHPPLRISERREGSSIFRRYCPRRSALFDFGEHAEEMQRNDHVTTYVSNGIEYHREFAILPMSSSETEPEILAATFDVLHMLAIRRTKLFRAEFSKRVYSVILPGIRLQQQASRRGYCIFPCLSLYRTARQGFRRTLSLSYIICPIKIEGNRSSSVAISARSVFLDELQRTKNEILLESAFFDRHRSSGDSISGAGRSYFLLNESLSLSEVLHEASKITIRRILGGGKMNLKDDTYLDAMMEASSQESRMVSMTVLVNWRSSERCAQPWESWIANRTDHIVRNAIFRTAFYSDYLEPMSSDVSRHAIQLERLMIGSEGGTDIGGLTLYAPHESFKIVLFPIAREKYPNYSAIRWMTWQIYIDSALTALRAIIFSYHPAIEDRGQLNALISTLDDMVQESVDFYDLDLRDLLYREEFERIRGMMKVNYDYRTLVEKFAAAKVDESLREQRLINKLIVALTIATVSVTVVSTIADILGEKSLSWYLFASALLCILSVLAGYFLFDPARRGYIRLVKSIVRSLR